MDKHMQKNALTTSTLTKQLVEIYVITLPTPRKKKLLHHLIFMLDQCQIFAFYYMDTTTMIFLKNKQSTLVQN
jgi:hypothetical protein